MALTCVLADHIAPQSGDFEPQRQHNFTLEVAGLPGGPNDSDILALSVASGFLPTGYNEEVEIPYGNERVYVAGKAVWDAGQMIIRDYVDRNTAGVLLNWRRLVYDPVDGHIGLASQYKKEGYIHMFGPNSVRNRPTFNRTWNLRGIWPIRVNFAAQGLDMASSNQVMIEAVLRYDKAFAEFAGQRQN